MQVEVVTTVQLDTASKVEDLASDTRTRSHNSLAFFLSHVLKVNVPTELCVTLQRLNRKTLCQVVGGTALWLAIHKCKMTNFLDHDAVRWLFPEVKDGAK